MNSKSKINNLLVIVLLLIAIVKPVSAQTYKKEIKSADKAFLEGRYKDAAEYYNNASLTIKSVGKEHLELFYKLGYCEMRIGDYRKAINSYAKYMAIAKKYKVSMKELEQVKEWNDWCGIELSEPMNSRKPKGYNEDIEIICLTALNSVLNDNGAVLIENNSLFILSSNRPLAEDKEIFDMNNNIFVAKYTNGEISSPLKIKADFNTKFDDISSSYCEATQTLFLTFSKDMYTSADIYSCKKVNDHWAEPVKLQDVVNSNAWEGYPSISRDGKILYFSSDRPGGSGGKDIYFTILKDDGNWSEPKTLGPMVNTKYDEITPHIDSTGLKLYFSSNGHLGVGGFDIYYTEFEASNLWGEPTHLPQPINSETDDIFYTTTTIASTSLFSSKRKGGNGVYDIYMIKPKSVQKPEKEIPAIAEVKPGMESKTEKEGLPEIKVKESNTTETPVKETKSVATTESKTTTETKPKTEPVTKTASTTQAPKPTTGSVTKTETPQVTASTGTEINETQLYNASIDGLYFKVQIGAYKNHITKNHQVFASKLNPGDITEEQWPPDYLYKYTIGQYFTISTASAFKTEIRQLGYSDAFLTCYYNSNRISMTEAKEIIKKNYRIN